MSRFRCLGLLVWIAISLPLSGMAHDEEQEYVSKRAVLDVFFRVLLEESQGGFVLYGSKPACIEGILPSEENLFMVGGILHRRIIVLREGLRVWEKIPLKKNRQRYFIQSYKPISYGWEEVAVVNSDEVVKSVRDNLPLFQYILGPKTTPQGVLCDLTNCDRGFSPSLKHDKVLTGIILGFGTQNALHVSHQEILEDKLYRTEKIPLISLSHELDELEKETLVSKDIVRKAIPGFPWFGCLRGPETKKLLDRYSREQKKVQEILNSQDLLEKVLQHFLENRKQSRAIIKTLSGPAWELKNIDWTSLIVRSILQGIPTCEEGWMRYFVKGMYAFDLENTLLSDKEWDRLRNDVQQAERELMALDNLIETKAVFQALTERDDLTCIVPDKLYFYSKNEGQGESLESEDATVYLKYTISNPSEESDTGKFDYQFKRVHPRV